MMLNPKKICAQCIIRKTTQLYGIVSGNRREPKEDGSHRIITTTSAPKINLEAGRHDDSTQLIHIQADGFQWDDQATSAFIELK
jgi:hypothetical protein